MIVTTTWEPSDIKPGVKVVDKSRKGLDGIIVVLRSAESSDNVIHPSTYAIMGPGFDMTTQFMTATLLAKLLTENRCTL